MVAVSFVVYAATIMAHEGLGHGGACLAVHAKPTTLNAIYFACDRVSGSTADRIVAAGGTVVDLVFGAVGSLIWFATRRGAWGKPSVSRWALWLFTVLNLLQACGYFLFSGVGNIGDWAEVVRGLSPAWAYRAGLAVLGAVTYASCSYFAARMLAAFLGPADAADAADEGRAARARPFLLVPYVAGGLLYVAAGVFNPDSLMLVLVSAAASSFGGASGFCWLHHFLDGSRIPAALTPPFVVPASRAWMIAGGAVALIYVGVFGPGVRFQ